MKQKLANYISETLVKHGITQNFSVTGGGAMHLNDAFGHQEGMYTLYQHHEQACAMAAESYARIYNRPALVCVTSGPGGTNAITGVVGAWLDSIPMIVISGQVRYDNTARWSGVGIRSMGDQEFDITKSIACMTKYCEMLIDPYRVRFVIEKCLYLSQTGRPGPCWIDIPVNIQGTYIETDDLVGFDPEDYENGGTGWAKYQDGQNRHPETAEELQDSDLSYEDPARNILTEADVREDKKTMLESFRMMENPHVIPADSDPTFNGNGPREELPEQNLEQLEQAAGEILDKIQASERPIFYTGNGIRIAGAEKLFLEVAHRLQIPVVVGWNGPDVIPTADPLYAGRPGGRGDRPGNLAVQNADLILSIGSRLNIRQVGYNFKTWARDAYVIVDDIDSEELRKPSVHADMRIHADAANLLKAILNVLNRRGIDTAFNGGKGMLRKDAIEIADQKGFAAAKELAGKLSAGTSERISWLETCQFYNIVYPTVLPEYLAPSKSEDEYANVYAVVQVLSELSKPGQITVVGNGSPCVAGGQAYIIKDGARFISQDAIASMGYGLPAAIGACAAVHGVDSIDTLEKAKRDVYWTGFDEEYPDYKAHDILLMTGDGSIQMNLQELQTIITHKMPIKIFLINNGGYHSIRQTQNSFFGKPLVGIGIDSGTVDVPDLTFPDFEKLSAAYGYPYIRVSHNEDLRDAFERTLAVSGPGICEIMVTLTQEFLPKSAAKKLPDGSLVSPPLEDLAPFLPDEEMDKVMLVKRVK